MNLFCQQCSWPSPSFELLTQLYIAFSLVPTLFTQVLRVLGNIAYKGRDYCVGLTQAGLLPVLCATLKMADQEMVTLSLEVLFMLVASSSLVSKLG